MMLLIIPVLDGDLKWLAFALASRRILLSGLSIAVCDAFSSSFGCGLSCLIWFMSIVLSGVLFAVPAVLSQVHKV